MSGLCNPYTKYSASFAALAELGLGSAFFGAMLGGGAQQNAAQGNQTIWALKTIRMY